MVVNQTSRVGDLHLVDYLLKQQLTITRIFAPEHGFRGEAGAGELIGNSKDRETGIPIVSIYGKNHKPTAAQLEDIDIVIFDIQDVGCRFYTYISTLLYVMEACAENNKTLLILDPLVQIQTVIISTDLCFSPRSAPLSEWTRSPLFMAVQSESWHK